jgi:hypothetical protein
MEWSLRVPGVIAAAVLLCVGGCGSSQTQNCTNAAYPLYCPNAHYCCPAGYPYDCNGHCYESPPTTECGTSYDTCGTSGSSDAGPVTSFDGVWSANWSYTIGNWWTGTINATDCHFSGSTTLSVGGALGSGNFMAKGTEHMTCSNAETDLDYNFGGNVDSSGVIAGNFYYWNNTYSISYAGTCSGGGCSANGSDSFVLSMTKSGTASP